MDPPIPSLYARFVFLRARALARQYRFYSLAEAAQHVRDLVLCPRLRGGGDWKSQRERRQARHKPPPEREGFALYRSDGAARGQGAAVATRRCGSGWGAAFFGLGPHADIPVAESWAYLGEGVSNNVAEYLRLRAALAHTLQARHQCICFRTDSKLVAEQANYTWACRSEDLRPLLGEIWALMRALEGNGRTVIVEHIFREYNSYADRLVNRAVDSATSQPWRHTRA